MTKQKTPWSTYFGFEPAGDDYQIQHHNIGLAAFYAVILSIAAMLACHACGIL